MPKMELQPEHYAVSSRFYSDMSGHELDRFLEFTTEGHCQNKSA